MRAKYIILSLFVVIGIGTIGCQKENPQPNINTPAGGFGTTSHNVIISNSGESYIYYCGDDLTLYSGVAGNTYEWTPGGATTRWVEVPFDTARVPVTYSVVITGNGTTLTLDLDIVFADYYIIFPGFFSPNGDGINDHFFPFYRGCINTSQYELQIFDPESGQTIYESNDITEGWNGNRNGREVPLGSYPYWYKVLSNGILFEDGGNVVILR